MLANYANDVFGLMFSETDLASGRHRRQRKTEPEVTFVGGYSYRDDVMLHPRYVPRPAACDLINDWETRYRDLGLASAFRREVGVREPLEEFSELDAELRRVFGDAGRPLHDDPGNGVGYPLMLVVPTLHCGIVGWDRPGQAGQSLGYMPAYSQTVRSLADFAALHQAQTLGKLGQLVSDHSDELAQAFPSKRPVRLDELDFAGRRTALGGLGAFADPLARRLQAIPRRPASTPAAGPIRHHSSGPQPRARRLRP